MDFASAVKSDAFAPILTYVLPGAVATAPYVMVVASYFPRLADFGKSNPTALTLIVTLLVLLVGALLEELGTRLETRWDKEMKDSNWEPYLRLRLNDEIIGQRYLRRILIRMKFELSMAIAMPIMILGLVWANFCVSLWAWSTFVGLGSVLFGLFAWITWESYESAVLLHKTRQLIIDAVQARGEAS